MIKILIFLFVLVSTSVFSQTYTIADIPLELKKNANSILLSEKEIVDVSENGKLNYKIHRVKVILNENGNKDIASHIYYNKDTKIKKIDAYVYDVFGNELKHIKKKDFVDVSAADGFSIFRDSRVVYLKYVPTTYPYIVEFTSEVENNSTAFLPSWYPLGGYNRSTKKSEFILKFDPNNKPRFKTANLEGFNVSVSENPSEIICTAENIKAIRYEQMSPPFSKIVPNIDFALNRFTLKGVHGSAKNWNEFGTWMNNSLLVGKDDIPESTIKKINNLLQNETTNEAKARIVYNYLQEKVRYVSIQIGIGGWKPMLASDVDKLSYGDCKALTNYTKSILDAIGIPSYYTVLYADETEKDFDKNFSRLEGNHAILGVPDGDKITWLECTSQTTPYGYVSDMTDDRDVLIVTPEGGKIAHTKKYSSKENFQDSKIKVFIDTDGSAIVNFNSTSKGLQYGDKLRIDDKNEDDKKDYYKDRWDNINGFIINTIQLENNKEEIVFTEKVNLKIPKYCSKIGKDYLFPVNVLNRLSYVPPRLEERKNELYISRDFEDYDVVEIEIPKGYIIDELPGNKQIENEFGSYTVAFEKVSDHKIKYTRQYMLKKGFYPKEMYNEFRQFKRKIVKLDKAKMVLKAQN